jgi:hypothetical protein
MKNYSLGFKRDGTAQGFAELAKTQGQAIANVLERTDYALEELIDIREVFGTPRHDKFMPS